MVFREVSVIEIREVLRAWLAGKSERAVASQAGVDRKTSRRYVTAAGAAGLSRGGVGGRLPEGVMGGVVGGGGRGPRGGRGGGGGERGPRREEITAWVAGEP